MRILTIILFSLLLSGCIHVFDESKPLIRGEGINDEHIVEAEVFVVKDGMGVLRPNDPLREIIWSREEEDFPEIMVVVCYNDSENCIPKEARIDKDFIERLYETKKELIVEFKRY